MNPVLRRTIPNDMIGTLADAIATGLDHVHWITLALALAVMATALLLPPRLNARLDTQRRRLAVARWADLRGEAVRHSAPR